jgi:hypothetical protein
MYDDGNLSHGDEIQGDGLYSNSLTLNRAHAGQIRIRVQATSNEIGGPVTSYSPYGQIEVVAQVSQQVADATIATQEAGAQQYNAFATQYGAQQAPTMTVQWLLGQPGVASASISASRDISIRYTTGLTGVIIIDEPGTDGGSGGTSERGIGPRILPFSQTVGTFQPSYQKAAKAADQTVGSNKVLVYAPNHAQFLSWGTAFEDQINTLLTNSSCPHYEVTYLQDGAANVDALDHLCDYGLIVIHTHGGIDGNDVIFLTGEEYSFFGHFFDHWILGRLTTATHTGSNDTYWAIRPSFISSRAGTCPNTIVYNGSCQSAQNLTMSNAFIGKGTSTYFGFSETVGSGFDRDMAMATLPNIINGSMSTSQAFTPGQSDPGNMHASFLMLPSSAAVRVGAGLLNGDFEQGSLSGWTSTGDGRVITQLGFLLPTGGTYMGVVSTGLGFTTTSGAIEQSFCLPSSATTLTLRWNFLSEEFMEWVGSQYQDYFRIVLTDEGGTQHVVLSTNVDYLAHNFQLSRVSPGIVFDQGDVWMTGWQSLSYNVSGMAGQTVTLRMEAGDVGDSIYDTAVLIDDVKLQ